MNAIKEKVKSYFRDFRTSNRSNIRLPIVQVLSSQIDQIICLLLLRYIKFKIQINVIDCNQISPQF